tara:strand:+ start:708 stop:1007 length:300 start_codon:yes stop_codon:yes gene_type:complete
MIIHIFIVMDYKFLDKVLDQIIFETTIDYGKERLYTSLGSKLYSHPFWSFTSFLYLSPLFPPHSFYNHCEEVYGLNKEETEYIWVSFKRIITEKLNNGL